MPQTATNGIIDMSKAINAIKQKYGERYYHSDAAQAEVTALWKCTPNKCGVIPEKKRETIVSIGGCKGEVSFAQTPIGWLIGVDVSTSISGSYYAPSIWDDSCFTTYQHARQAGIQEITEFFESTLRDNCGSSDKTRNDTSAALAALRLEKASLFSLF